jgi:dimethylhistidine N-methyltransferase
MQEGGERGARFEYPLALHQGHSDHRMSANRPRSQPVALTDERRLTILGTGREVAMDVFRAHVRDGLSSTPKRLSCEFLYDQQGSLLFEEICRLPEYYLTRCEEALLREHAAVIVDELPPDVSLVELGSGSATKTRILIDELLRRHGRLLYAPIDISRTMLERSSRALLAERPGLEVLGLATEYHAGLHELRSSLAGPRLVLFLGSNVGNFPRADAAAFLARVRDDLSEDDRLLVGIDLRKDRGTLERAYDDSSGVTARFMLNLLARIDRELGGHFDVATFRHRAEYREDEGRVVLELESLRDQTVRIDALATEFDFAAGERIHVEDSYKYSLREIEALAQAAGFEVERQWLDAGPRFSLSRLIPR